MTNSLTTIEKQLSSKDVMAQLVGALGFVPENPIGLEKAKKYVLSVMSEIKRSAGDPKKDLTVCTIDSISQAMIDAAKFRLAIDGRRHAHLVKYYNKDKNTHSVQLQIGVAGYVAKINEHFPDAVIGAEVVYEGDTLDTVDKDGYESYTFRRKNNFESDINKIVGAFAVVSYSIGGKRYQHVEKMPRADINKIRGKAKQDYIWAEWFTEKAKVAVVRRACKIPFQSIQGLQEMLEYDNRQFDLDKEGPATALDRNIVDNLNDVIEGKAENIEEKQEDEQVKFIIKNKKGETEYGTIEEFEKATFDILKNLKKSEQFVNFVQLNHEHWEKCNAVKPQVIERLNAYMIERQEKLQAGNEGETEKKGN